MSALDGRHGRDQALRVGVLRSGEHRSGIADFDDLAGIHHRDAMRDALDHRHVVRDEEIGEAEFASAGRSAVRARAPAPRHRAPKPPRRARPPIGVEHQRPRDAEALPLAAGELVRIAGQGSSSGRPTRFSSIAILSRTAASMRGAGCDAGSARRLSTVEARIERGIRVLEHHLHGQIAVAGDEFPLRHRIAPRVAGTSPSMARAVVDLPEPLSPTIGERLARHEDRSRHRRPHARHPSAGRTSRPSHGEAHHELVDRDAQVRAVLSRCRPAARHCRPRNAGRRSADAGCTRAVDCRASARVHPAPPPRPFCITMMLVGDAGDEPDVVGDEDHRHAGFALEFGEQAP